MKMMTLFALVAALGAVAALVSGLASMACDGEIAHWRSEQWMGWRVLCQAAALLFVLLGISGTASIAQTPVAGAQPEASRECVYDYRLMTTQECRSYRIKVLQARSDDDRIALRDELHRQLKARARDRSVDLNDWRGQSAPVGATR